MIAPGGEEGFFEDAFSGFGEEHAGGAFAAPGAVAWVENGRMGLNEIFLLERSKLDHSKLFVGIGEGGEDFSGDAEVGVVHVLALFGFGEAESDAAEVGGSGWHVGLQGRVSQHGPRVAASRNKIQKITQRRRVRGGSAEEESSRRELRNRLVHGAKKTQAG